RIVVAWLARRPNRQFDPWRVRQANRAEAHASVYRPRQEEVIRGRVRAPALHPAQVNLECDLPPSRTTHGGALSFVDLMPDGHLQRNVSRRPAGHLLPRSA